MSCKNAVLVGDSVYDKNGAEIAGVDFLGVTYGFGIKKATKPIQDLTPLTSVELTEYFKIN